MGNGDERMAEAGTACSGGSGVATCWRQCKERRFPRARHHGSSTAESWWRGSGERRKVGVGYDVDGGGERAVGGDGAATTAVSPLPSIHGVHSTVPPAQGPGKVLRQPEAEEARQGRAGKPKLELQSHDGEGSGGGHHPCLHRIPGATSSSIGEEDGEAGLRADGGGGRERHP
uniref:DUF834 domain-containing protein n=1 Tax=Oryza meridionalis TaxID=40149 RepID=A0A0E0FC01_9ORYZ